MRYLEKTELNSTTGWFSPETLQIYISGYAGDNLNSDQLQVLNHELLHYLHFTSTTLGVSFMYQNFKELNYICDWKFKTQSNDSINKIYDEVIKINRFKARLVVPSYYFMTGPKYKQIGEAEQWVVNTSVGTFFKANGQLSDQNFIMHRFVAGDINKHSDLIARVSFGTKYLYEHLIKFIDLMIDMERDGLEEAYSYHYENAYYGPLLPYSGLALVCARYNVKGLDAFILSAVLAHLTLMLPPHWTKKNKGLKNYIENRVKSEVGLQKYFFKSSHPSVVVEAFLQKALELGASQINFFEFFDSTNEYEKLNAYIENLCNQFGFSTTQLFKDYEIELSRLEGLEVNSRLRDLKEKLCDEMRTNLEIKKSNFGKYIVSPHSTKYKPFVSMDNKVIPGNLTSYDERDFLNYLIEQRDEMLRYNFERNIID